MTPECMRSESGTKLYGSLKTHGDAADALLERLRVRLGRDHHVAQEFEKVDTAVLEFWRAFGRLRNEPAANGHPAAISAIAKVTDEARTTLNVQRTAFDAHRAGFIDAAQRIAGTKL
jgi:hypothetical protein